MRLPLVLAGFSVAVAGCTEPRGDAPNLGPRLAVGEATTCALDPNGQLFCWGNNSTFFEFGESPSTRPLSKIPVSVQVPLLAGLSTGISQHMCGITSGRVAICWGRGGQGEMGRGEVTGTGQIPGAVTASGAWAGLTVGRITTCGWDTTGGGYCWGLNQRGEIGDTALPAGLVVPTPRPVVGNITFASISAGWTHTCGIAVSGAAYCWGSNSHGQLGVGFADNDEHARPLLVSFTQQFKSIALGARSTCAITDDDRLFCWGYNGTGQLGDGTTVQRNEPQAITPEMRFTAVSLASGFAGGTGPETVLPGGQPSGGVGHGCAIASTQQAYCWGWNGAGQIGNGSFLNTVLPTAVSGGIKFTSIALGGAHSCGMSDAGIYCWGANFYGQVGDNTFIDVSAPARVATPW